MSDVKPKSHLMIRANKGMIRDAFIDTAPNEGPTLVIRQIRFEEDGSLPKEVKSVRLTTEEANMLVQFWQREGHPL